MNFLNYIRDKFLWLIGCNLEKELVEFEKAFPDTCPICAYHNFGLMEGYISGPVKQHQCPNAINLRKMYDNAGTVGAWDYQSGTGSSIKDRFEGLYEKCVEMENILRHKGAEGDIWLYGPKYFLDIICQGHPRWIINANELPLRWKCKYTEAEFPRKNTIVMGSKSNNCHHYGRIAICNYPIYDMYQLNS